MGPRRLVRKELLQCIKPAPQSIFGDLADLESKLPIMSLTILTLLQLALVEVDNAVRAYYFSTASYPLIF